MNIHIDDKTLEYIEAYKEAREAWLSHRGDYEASKHLEITMMAAASHVALVISLKTDNAKTIADLKAQGLIS
jgi:hypothetical protein